MTVILSILLRFQMDGLFPLAMKVMNTTFSYLLLILRILQLDLLPLVPLWTTAQLNAITFQAIIKLIRLRKHIVLVQRLIMSTIKLYFLSTSLYLIPTHPHLTLTPNLFSSLHLRGPWSFSVFVSCTV